MTEALYERYKDALRRGHVAALRGRLDAALLAYGEAAGIAPERALPHTSLGTVLERLGREDEALAAFGRALERAPRDEGALAGRAGILATRGQRVEAAELLDRLAVSLADAGRTPEACDAARRALELAESRERRRLVESLVQRIKSTPADAASIAALEGALRVLGNEAADVIVPDTDGGAGPERSADAAADPGRPVAVEGRAGAGGTDGAGVDLDGTALPVADRVDRPGIALGLEAERHLDAGDGVRASEAWLRAAAAHRAAGELDAALDACYLALALAPDDPGLHLTLAEIYLTRGWRTHAADKLVLLARLVDLGADPATRDQLCALVGEHVVDDPRLVEVCA